MAIDQFINNRLASRRCIEQLRIDLLGTQAIFFFSHRLLKLLLGNLEVADCGDIAARTHTANVGINAKKSKGQRNQGQENLDDSFIVADCVEHEEKNPSESFKKARQSPPKG